MNHVTKTDRTGILLLSMGGPQDLDDVKPFLLELFSDRDIIRLPGGPLGQLLLSRLIVWLREPIVRKRYEAIGGSPLVELTTRQADALKTALHIMGFNTRALPAMRYGHPSITDALTRMKNEGIRDIVALSMYPHFSAATTGSSINELHRVLTSEFTDTFQVTLIDSWPVLDGYIQALTELIGQAQETVPAEIRDQFVLVFSAHGLPMKFINRGDPYVDDTEMTISAVLAKAGWNGPWRLGYQSRVGHGEWLSPTTEQVLTGLAEEGHRDVIIVPISFVTDHLETLYEIDLELRKTAETLGFRTFVRTEALNDNPVFIQALAELVTREIGKR